ncbi:transglutaminase-like cysteine peptidase [Phenylobacterium sp.]|uniref:transglutaminase-like cysteine peptidase n=1 Tax=Phenylobacterium sp. TaxID=1871053 RepID=UPI00391CCC86
MPIYTLPRAGLLALVLSLTAQMAWAAPSMPVGRTGLPPVGWVAFCAERPLACGTDAEAVRAGAARARAEREALLGGRPLPEAPRTPVPSAAAATPAPADPPILSPGVWALLVSVNAKVNRDLRPRADTGSADDWSLPLQDGVGVGDCEDYALEKAQALLRAGLPRSALNLALATTETGEFHAVLLVSTRGGDFVLDNRTDEVRRWDQVPYRWRARQVGGEPFAWATAPRAVGGADSRAGR